MGAISLFLFLWGGQTAQVEAIRAGTRVDVRLESRVETATSSPGEPVSAVFSEPVSAADRIVLPRGTRLMGRIETIAPATPTTEGRVRLVFREIEFSDGRKIQAWLTNSFTASPPKRTLRYVLYMGIGGAAGGLVGGRSARTAGILGGTLAGFVIAGNTHDENLPDLTLKPGQTLELQFGEDLKYEQDR